MKILGGKNKTNDYERRAVSRDSDTTFQRSRTISSYQPNGPADLERIHVRGLHAHRNRMLQIIGVLATLSVVCVLMLLNFTASATYTYTEAPSSQPATINYDAALNTYYSQHPFERLSFLLDTRSLSASLAAAHPEVAAISSVSSAGLGVTRYDLVLRKPVAKWQIGNSITYVDNSGKSFKADYFGSMNLVSVDDEGATTSGGGAVTSEAMIGFIGKMITKLKQEGVGTVDKVVIPAQSLREVDVYLERRGYRIKVQTDRDPELQVQDIKSAIGYLDQHGGAKEYIDVRVAGKAYYK